MKYDEVTLALAVMVADAHTKREDPTPPEAVRVLLTASERADLLEKRAWALQELLREFLSTGENTVGRLDHHYAITGTGGGPGSGEEWWGCSACGKGWPCLYDRARQVLALCEEMDR
jgi:hypothetical protein